VERVAVVGSGGAGKSTFARLLGERSGLPVLHLDRLFWKPGWVATPHDAWVALQRELAAADRWIMDGNFGSTIEVRLARADTVIVLEPPRLVCLARAARRVLGNLGSAVQAEGCGERVDAEFFKWIWRFPRDSRPRLEAAIDQHHDHLKVVRLRSRRAVSRYLQDVAG
jgi:adenylate kinase family enzyme